MTAVPVVVDDAIDNDVPQFPRLLAGVTHDPSAVDLATHRQRYPAPHGRPGEIIAAVERSGLRGRGGAGFPTGRKFAAVAERYRRRPVVVANGAEGEPASAKDAFLLTRNPHLVLDGALLAATAVGASEVVVCIDRTQTSAQRAIRAAIAERCRTEPSAGILRVAAIPHRYVAGEETALVHWLNGGEAKPTNTPPRPFEAGVDGRATLVDNIETLAHVAQIVRWGPEWFRENGTADEPGTVLVTVSGAVERPGVLEVPIGARLGSLVRSAGGSLPRAGAVLVGGYFGAWLTPDEARLARLSNEDLRPRGAAVGCGAIVVLPADVCGLRETARLLQWYAGESAGQCGSCVHGLAAIAAGAVDLYRGTDTVAWLLRWADQVEGRGACGFPNGAVRLLRSTLRVFAGEVDRHRSGAGCSAARPDDVCPVSNTREESWQ